MAHQGVFAVHSSPLELPDEILEIILNGCDISTLKALRLASSRLERLATILVFRHVQLYPHMQSFEQLFSIASSQRLCHYVQTLHYDARWRGILPLVQFHVLEDHRSGTRDVLKQRQKFRQHIHKVNSQSLQAWHTGHQLTMMSVLEDTFASLLNLKEIVVNEATRSFEAQPRPDSEELPLFYQRLISGYQSHIDQTPHRRSVREEPKPSVHPCFLAFLAAARRLPGSLDAFRVEGMSWRSFEAPDLFKYSRNYINTLAKLKTLELGVDPSESYNPRIPQICENLQDLLRMAVNLEKLRLELSKLRCGLPRRPYTREIMNSSYHRPHLSIFQLRDLRERLPPCLTWSTKLKYLHLQGLICTQEELHSVLSACSQSLKELELARIIVLPDTPNGPRACLVKLIKFIQSHMQLEMVDFQGYMTNCGMQRWRFPSSPVDCGFKNEVIRFIVQGGPCPLEHVKIHHGYYDLGKQTWTAVVPSMLREKDYYGDASWIMYVRPDNEDRQLSEYEITSSE